MTVVAGFDEYKPEEDDQPVPLTQELNSKESAQLLVSRLKGKHQLAPGTTFYKYRDRERELSSCSRSTISHHWFIETTLLN